MTLVQPPATAGGSDHTESVPIKRILSMNEWLEELKETIESAAPRLLQISEAQSEQPRAEEHWSAKQIIGHLIDSATNNHARFVLGQLKNDLVFPGYDQDQW